MQTDHPIPTTPEPVERHEHDQVVVLRGVGWADYQRMLEIRADRSAPRFAYLEGVLETSSAGSSTKSSEPARCSPALTWSCWSAS